MNARRHVSKYSPGGSVLTPHVGHLVVVVDARTLRCDACAVALVLDANRVVPVVRSEPKPPEPGEKVPCPDCGRLLRRDLDGQVPLHVARGSDSRRCLSGRPPAALPPGGWRALAARVAQENDERPDQVPLHEQGGGVNASAGPAKDTQRAEGDDPAPPGNGGLLLPPGAPAPPPATSEQEPCCVCPPTCLTDDTGDTCIDASCGVCLHGCPAADERTCCRTRPDSFEPARTA